MKRASLTRGSPHAVAHRIPIRKREILRASLDELVETYDISTLSPDPLEAVRKYDDPRDREVAGLLAAAFAYGRADIIVRNVSSILEAIGSSPHEYLEREFTPAEARVRFRSFSHRFHKARDLVALLTCLAGAIREHGSLGALFASVHDRRDVDVGPSLARFARALHSYAGPRAPRSLGFLVSSPDDGSACKRMNLFLRWMVRRTSPDLGQWTFVDPSQLVMPVDTHVHRISTFLGLNRRKAADWKTARALTDVLATFDPDDPVRYDFAICRLGVLSLCSRKRLKENCDVCLLRDACRFPVT
ncbi:MAG: TIGR02757 family protein [Acidobacteria bacterium]|nr:TIGR02757 family protein [Acidobacteriota bacterium]